MAKPVEFFCPHCRYEMWLYDKQMGISVRCPSCDRSVETPTRETLEALGAFEGDQTLPTREPQPLDGRHLGIGCVIPGLMAAYGLGFGVLQRRVWFGAREYGGGGNVFTLTGDPALLLGIGFTVIALGLHVSGIWGTLYPARVSDKLVTLLTLAGVLCVLVALVMFSSQPPPSGN